MHLDVTILKLIKLSSAACGPDACQAHSVGDKVAYNTAVLVPGDMHAWINIYQLAFVYKYIY